MGMDPHDELAIVLELSRGAKEEDLAGARRLLDEWLSVYDDGPRYRNCGLEGDALGSTRLVLWADRIDDPGGPASAVRRALEIGRRASSFVSRREWRLDEGGDCGARDIEERLGVPLLVVRPGGDLVAQAEAAGLLPGSAARRRRRRIVTALAVIGLVALATWLAWR